MILTYMSDLQMTIYMRTRIPILYIILSILLSQNSYFIIMLYDWIISEEKKKAYMSLYMNKIPHNLFLIVGKRCIYTNFVRIQIICFGLK